MDRMCDDCRIRPAVHHVVVRRGGTEEELYLCDECYAKRFGAGRSPWESLFGGMLGDFFEDFFPESREPRAERRPRRESVDISDWLSEPARDALARSAEKAAEWG
ncbi:Clp protease ClpC, partial [Candidatus Acetothermia bacterium]